jgi:3-oxoacyl-[acyl-carrier-protein] synthase II
MSEHKKLLESGPRKISPFFIPMMIANMAAGMIAIRFGCKGAAMPAVTACASGSNAIGEALRAIRHGYADVMIAGGAEATVNEIALAGFTNMQALSMSDNPLEASLPFDKRRGGFVMGEGAGVLVLRNRARCGARREDHAELAVTAPLDSYQMTAPPRGGGRARAIADACTEAGMDTDKIISTPHGTGTL